MSALDLTQGNQTNRPPAAQEFVETVVHELRTPLHTASGFLAFLLQDMAGPVTAIQRDMLTSLGASLEQARSLVEDLLSMSQLEQGRLILSLETVDLKTVIKETIVQLSIMADIAGVKLSGIGLDLDGTEILVTAAKNRLGQCLRNLLSNALKFSPAGGEVKITIEHLNQHYIVRVTDQGPGIKPEHIKAIFQRYYQINDSDAAWHPGGYGLGLSITRDLIERQGGQIGVESIYGEGSCFWFSLPEAAPAGRASRP